MLRLKKISLILRIQSYINSAIIRCDNPVLIDVYNHYTVIQGVKHKMIDVIKRIIRALCPKCPKCNGVMVNDGVHITDSYVFIEIYTCENCGERWV